MFNYYIYVLPPIDDFDYAVPISFFAKKEMDSYLMDGYKSFDDYLSQIPIIKQWERAKKALVQATETLESWGWEGDYREDPCCFTIPCETDFTVGFVVKQDNNGTTFVISEVKLPHLDSICDAVGFVTTMQQVKTNCHVERLK